ncbi:substrate-binding periplasmic protein [Undibacterium fentianense]|uniref:Transporter substrate-binding domain-containing protein n=1 Tax=Undibacterium fentianense TaxID=2828728 RepID=A0A941IGV3_9BURK|nr:transporter substrate-binding domain-containing protein [Undibacterium fentianense]MBR7800370.1 transporter substrate-binding domain-containing protein [Undibacterium fentianense]
MCLHAQTGAAESLKLLYEVREPMFYRDAQGNLTGFIINRVNQASKIAGLKIDWVETPFKRQLKLVENNDEALCAVGMFKNKEREQFAKFSLSIYRDSARPSIMLAHRNFQPDKSMDLLRTLSIPGARMLKKETASYGTVIDDAIERSRITIVSTTAESLNMAKMIAAHRADFILVPEDEALKMIASIEDRQNLHIFKPVGMPQGPERFLMCSAKVSDEILQRMNRAIQKTHP